MPFLVLDPLPASARLLNVDSHCQRVILLTPDSCFSSKNKLFRVIATAVGSKVGVLLRPRAEKDKSAETTSRDQGRVLLITDETDIAYRKSLESAGLKIVGVSAGTAALAPVSVRVKWIVPV